MSRLLFLLLLIASRSDAAISADGKYATYIDIVWSKADQAAQKFTSGCTCLKPQEDVTLAKNCRPLGSSEFPSPKAVCDCVKCKRNATLSCSCDGRWYADVPSQCDVENHCGMCPPLLNHEDVRCTEFQAGSINEKRTCRCRVTCVEVSLTCDEFEDGSSHWQFDDNNAPCDNMTYASVPYVADVRSSDGLQIVLFKGSYSFSCVGSGHLDQREVQEVTCKDGEIMGQFPSCITGTSISTTENNQETTGEQQTSSTDELASTSATFVSTVRNSKIVYVLMYAAITIMSLVLLICCTTIAIMAIKRRKHAKYSTQKGAKIEPN